MRSETRVYRLFIAVMLATVSSGCARSDDRTVPMDVGGTVFTIELAATPEQRQQGLMHREELAANTGMLFIFPESAPRSFWMKDTPLPLSIAFISSEGRILEIYDMEPLSLTPVRSRFPAKYALEVNQGRFDELGIEPGDRIDLEALPRSLRE